MINKKAQKMIGIFIAMGIFIVASLALAASGDIASCTTLNTANSVYTLTGNVNISGTCFAIGANNVTLDCNNYMVNYSQSAIGYGVNNTGYNFTTVKNCNFVEGSASGNNNHGVYYYNSYNGTIYNNVINTSKTDSYGIYLYNSNYQNISNNIITTRGNSAYDIYLRGTSNSIIKDNNLYATSRSSGQYALYLYNAANNNTLSYNNINATGDSACIRLSSNTDNNKIIYNNATTESGNAIDISGGVYVNVSYNKVIHLSGASWGIYLNTVSNTTVFYNNINITGSSSVGIYLLSNANYHDIEFNNISSSGNGAMGMQIRSNSNSNYFNSNDIRTYGTGNVGIRFRAGSTGNVLNNLNILTFQNGGSYPIDIYDSSANFTIYNSKVNASSGNADFIIGASPGGIWNFVNVTRSDNNLMNNISWTAGENGTLSTYWYLDTNVTNQGGLALNNSNVSIYYGNGTYIGSNLTDSNGVARFILPGFIQNSSSERYYSALYIANVSKESYVTASNSSVNMSNNVLFNVIMTNADATPPNITIISPANMTYNTNSVFLNYTANDSSGVSTCWYSLDGSSNISLPSCATATISGLTEGSHTINVYANDTLRNANYSSVVFSIDSVPPAWSNMVNSTPASYSATASYFNVTWSGGAQIVLFESNFSGVATNYTMYLISGGIYGFNATLPAGTFYWKSYANDSLGNLNATSAEIFTINQAGNPVSLYLNGNLNQNATITYGTGSNATGIASSGTANLYRDGNSASNPEIKTLAANANGYKYTINTTGNENYTANSTEYYLIVNKAAPSLSLLLNGNASDKSVNYGTTTNATGSESNNGDSDIVYTFYRNGESASNPEVGVLTAGVYTYIYNTTGGENYTSGSASRILTINKATSVVRLFLNGNEGNASQTYGSASNATATDDDRTPVVYRNGIEVSNPDISTLGAGSYNYTAVIEETENITGSSVTYFLTLNKATPTLKLLINSTDSDASFSTGVEIGINASASAPAGATVKLYEDDVLVESGVSPSAIKNYSTTGDRIWKVNISESENYTSAEKSHTVSIIDASYPQYSSLKESPSDPATYSSSAVYQFNATWTDNIGISDIILEFNGINYSLANGELSQNGNNYYKDFSRLGAGSYNYQWFANDTSNNWIATPIQTYTINKAVAALFLTITPSNSVSYGTSTSVTCSANNIESSPSLTRNTTSVSNPDSNILGVGAYNYACTAAATENYTSASATSTLTVSKATPVINLTLNSAASDLTLGSSGGDVNITATLISPASGNLNLTQDNALINNGASPLSNLTNYNTAGGYTIAAGYGGNDNYTSGSTSRTITVQSAGGGDNGGHGGGGGGGTIIVRNATNVTVPITRNVTANATSLLFVGLELENISNAIMNPGELKKMALSARSSGTSYLNKCKIKGKGEYGSWISSSEVKDLGAGQKYDFIFSIKLPENINDGSYQMEVSLKCDEIEKSAKFDIEVIKKKLVVSIINAEKEKDGAVKLTYSLEELAGEEQDVNVEIVMFTNNGEKIANMSEKRAVSAKSKNKFEILIELPDGYDLNVHLIINANSLIASSFTEEYILLGGGKMSGFAIFSDTETRNKYLTWGAVFGFIIFALIVGMRIMRYRGIHTRKNVISSMVNQIIHGSHYHKSDNETRIIHVG